MSSTTPTSPADVGSTSASIPSARVTASATPGAIDNTIERLKERTPEATPVAEPRKYKHVVNGSNVKATVKLRNANGKEDYMHVMGRRHVRLPEGHTVDPNYLVLNKHIKVIEV